MLIYGIGVFDAEPDVTNKEARALWSAILRRCYSEESLARWPTYRGVSVCEEWHSFSAFKKWYNLHYKEGFELDKDLLGTSYCPETCVFIPQWLNKLLTSFDQKERALPTGVSLHGKGYKARVRHPFKGQIHLGSFSSVDEARTAYVTGKIRVVKSLKERLMEIDHRLYEALLEKIEQP